jgi:hypothetical protein
MDYHRWYNAHSESRLKGRYITLDHLNPLIESYKNLIEISTVGSSELGKDIALYKIGSGEKIVLGWSQMHGNEATTTKALFDFFKFITQKEDFQDEIKRFLSSFTLFMLPMLNPDGAAMYSRENANSVDLNRDAQDLSQKESRVLNSVFKSVSPDICINLHDQRSIYGLSMGKPATVSFLAPAADETRGLTDSRKLAMAHIVRMNKVLQQIIPGQIGRYDDGFNLNCVGDTFQKAGVPTILFEAGHTGSDYDREQTRAFIFYAFLELFGFSGPTCTSVNYQDYFDIPQNMVNFKDLILRNVKSGTVDAQVDIAIQFSEVLENRTVKFEPVIDFIGDCSSFYGHKEIDLLGDTILINSQEKFEVADKISIIVRKKEPSVIIFSKK